MTLGSKLWRYEIANDCDIEVAATGDKPRSATLTKMQSHIMIMS